MLDKLILAYPAKNLSLSVDSSVSLQWSNDAVPSMNSKRLLGFICSGKVWVTRGNGCHLDFRIHCNGQQLDRLLMERIVEDLGHSIRDAPVSPSTTLDTWH